MCLRSLEGHPNPAEAHFYSSSGGNAGLACATAARAIGRKATVVVPEATSELMRAKIRAADAKVFVHGASWKEADEFLREMIRDDENAVYCPPFDHEYVWEGNSSIVDEIATQLPADHPVPDAIVLSVGGGGLLNGVLFGLHRYGWDHVPVLAVETDGADSLATSLKLGVHYTLPKITSTATSLGARRISDKTWELAKNGGKDAGFDVRSAVLSDEEAMMGCWRLADDERLLVENACGVSVATCYNGVLHEKIPELNKNSLVVVIVCGGSNVSLDMLGTAKAAWIKTQATKRFKEETAVEQQQPAVTTCAAETIDPDVPSSHTVVI